MARLKPITGKDDVPAEHHGVVDAVIKSRGGVQGPFKMLLHCPPLAAHLVNLGGYVRFEGKLDHRVRVLAAMVVAREFEGMYVWGAQTGQARKQKVPEVRTYKLSEAAEAHKVSEGRHFRGKLVFKVR